MQTTPKALRIVSHQEKAPCLQLRDDYYSLENLTREPTRESLQFRKPGLGDFDIDVPVELSLLRNVYCWRCDATVFSRRAGTDDEARTRMDERTNMFCKNKTIQDFARRWTVVSSTLQSEYIEHRRGRSRPATIDCSLLPGSSTSVTIG